MKVEGETNERDQNNDKKLGEKLLARSSTKNAVFARLNFSCHVSKYNNTLIQYFI